MLRQALSADEAQTLFTLSAFFIGFGLGQLLLGPLSDRFGRKRPAAIPLNALPYPPPWEDTVTSPPLRGPKTLFS
jgi:MFS family permease